MADEEDSLPFLTPEEIVDEGRTFERLERLHNIIDTDNDALIDVVEMADLVFLFEDMEYIDFETAMGFSHWALGLHFRYGKNITINEIHDDVEMLMDLDPVEATLALSVLNFILDAVDVVIFWHGSIVDFFEIDKDDDDMLDAAELADRRISSWLNKYDSNDDDVLDIEEYLYAVGEKNTGYKYEGLIDEFSTRMDEEGLLMGNEELEEEFNYELA